MTLSSAIYTGEVVHTRQRPRKHNLNYKVFSLLVDLDELASMSDKFRMFGHNRRAVFSFHDSDHGTGEKGALRAWVEAQLVSAGIHDGASRIRVLCYPRIFGYVFNPLTVYFCESADGSASAILYEVCNTFHERHTYIIPVKDAAREVRQSCAKELYVSPFVPMECMYDFHITLPEDRVRIAIGESDREGPLLFAAFTGTRREISDRSLFQALISYPLMTLKVTAAIHWEALRLWWKGVRVIAHTPAASKTASSVIDASPIRKAPS
jgi:uncharacterized protein